MANISNINNVLRTGSTGIGINCDPEFTLDVERSSASAVLSLNSVGGSGAEYLIFSGTDGSLTFNKRNVGDRLYIASGGNIGIGTSSPAQKVEIAGGYLKFSGGDYGIQGSASLTYNPVSDHYFQANGSTKVTIKAAGNVGIGTASPTSPAGVARFLEIEGTTAGIVLHDNGNDPYEIWASGGNLVFRYNNTGGENGMLLSSSGNLGIGTTSPSALLDVSSGTTTDVIRFGANSRWGFSRANNDNRYLSFMRNQNGSGTAVWTVDGDNGKVGIGTTSPIVPVHIVGTAVNNPSNGNGGYEVMQIFDDTSYATGVGGGIGLGGNFTGSNSTIFSEIRGIKENATDNNYAGALTFSTRANGANITERMRITSDGYIGIGTTTPSSYNSRGRNLVISGSGDVGISIDCSSANSGSILFADGTGGTAGYRGVIEYDHDGDFMTFDTAASERMRINNSGTVYIMGATASVNNSLQLGYNSTAGSAEISALSTGGNTHFEFYTSNAGTTSEKLRIKHDGKVGIGTTNPQNQFVIKEGSNVDMEFGSEPDGCFIQTYNRTSNSWGYLRFIAGGGERMRITRVGGEVLINQTSDLTGQIFQINGMIDQTDVTKAIRVYNGSTFVGGIGSGQWAISPSYATDYALYAQNNLLFHAGTGSSIDMRINANHNVVIDKNLGIGGRTPDTSWGSDCDILQVGAGDNDEGFFGWRAMSGADQLIMGWNCYHDNTNWKFDSNNPAGLYVQRNGSHWFYGAASGSADANINWTTQMYLDTGGNVGIGTASPTSKLTVRGALTVGDSTTDSTIRRQHQTFSTMKPGPSSGGNIDMMFVDHTHTLDVTVMAYINTSTVAVARGYSSAAYGSASAGFTQTNFSPNGTISAISLSYINSGGSEAYILRVNVTYSGSTAPVISMTANGQSTSKLRAAT